MPIASDVLRMAAKNYDRATTVMGQILSATDDGTRERLIRKWEQLRGREFQRKRAEPIEIAVPEAPNAPAAQ